MKVTGPRSNAPYVLLLPKLLIIFILVFVVRIFYRFFSISFLDSDKFMRT